MKTGKLTALVAVLIMALLALPGCASKYGAPRTKVNYYPQCYQPVQQLRDDENYVAKSTATGAVGGALLGALIGGLATGKVEGALAGAAAGGVAGGVAGHAYGKSQQAARDREFVQAYSEQLGYEASGMARSTAAAQVAQQCYDREFLQAKRDFKARRITKAQFQERYAEIRSGLQEVSYILTERYDTMAKKDAEYEQALAKDPALRAHVQSPAATTSRKRTTSAKPRNRWQTSHQEMAAQRDRINNDVDAKDREIAALVADTQHT